MLQRPEIYTQVFFTETFDAPKPPTSTDGLKDPEWALQGNPGTMIPDLDPEAVKILDLTQHPEYLTGDVCSAIISAKKDRIILFPAYDKVYDWAVALNVRYESFHDTTVPPPPRHLF